MSLEEYRNSSSNKSIGPNVLQTLLQFLETSFTQYLSYNTIKSNYSLSFIQILCLLFNFLLNILYRSKVGFCVQIPCFQQNCTQEQIEPREIFAIRLQRAE